MKDELVTLLPRWCGNMIVLRSEAVHDTSEYTAMTTARNPARQTTNSSTVL
jgi:hypothetical protein